MSGLDKSQSAVLTHGCVTKSCVKNCAGKLACTNVKNTYSYEVSHKGDGNCSGMSLTGACTPQNNDGTPGYNSSWVWEMCKGRQLNGLTMKAKLNSGGDLCAMVDWGTTDLHSNLSHFSHLKLNHLNGSTFSGGHGLVWDAGNWGCMAVLQKGQDEKSQLCDKFWLNRGPLSVSANGVSCLDSLKVSKVSMDAQYKVNKNLCATLGWKGCQKSGWQNGCTSLSVGFCGMPNWKLATNLCRSVCPGEEEGTTKSCLRAAVGAKHTEPNGNLWKMAVDCDMNVKLGHCNKVNDNVTTSWTVGLPMKMLGNKDQHKLWRNWLKIEMKMSCEE